MGSVLGSKYFFIFLHQFDFLFALLVESYVMLMTAGCRISSGLAIHSLLTA